MKGKQTEWRRQQNDGTSHEEMPNARCRPRGTFSEDKGESATVNQN